MESRRIVGVGPVLEIRLVLGERVAPLAGLVVFPGLRVLERRRLAVRAPRELGGVLAHLVVFLCAVPRRAGKEAIGLAALGFARELGLVPLLVCIDEALGRRERRRIVGIACEPQGFALRRFRKQTGAAEERCQGNQNTGFVAALAFGVEVARECIRTARACQRVNQAFLGFLAQIDLARNLRVAVVVVD